MAIQTNMYTINQYIFYSALYEASKSRELEPWNTVSDVVKIKEEGKEFQINEPE